MRTAALGAGALAGALLAYLSWLRPRQLRWGATEDELAAALPGDDLVPKPTFNATRGVTVNAGPGDIWPWLLQMGCGRAGWYAYDWIDNLGRPSADVIVDSLQDLRVGDIVPISPDGKHGFRVREMEAERWMLWEGEKGDTSWYWGLHPAGPGRTRLVTRVRVRYRWLSPWTIFFLAMDFGDIIMMRKCMLGIRKRAERLARRRSGAAPALYTHA